MNAAVAAVTAILAGERRAVARAITALEGGGAAAQDLRNTLRDHVGRAHVVGVTGPPGGGKSTLVSALIKALRARRRTVAVAAVDPSSPFTGGAVLGDRIRMGEHQADEGVFIRSLASRGHSGGLSKATADAVDVFDAAGFDVVIVETVGAGQSEVQVTHLADTRLVLCPPGLGDDIQALKAGVLEIADALVVSKADLPESSRTESELLSMLALRRGAAALPPVFKTVAPSGDGIAALADWLEQRTQRGTRHLADGSSAARALVARSIARDNYVSNLGLELIDAGRGHATVRLRVGPQHLNFNGRCHGGAIFSLGDTALGLACNSYGRIAALVDGNISISTAVEEGEWLVARATELSRSRRIGSYRVDITRARDDAHVSSLSGTVYLLELPVEAAGTSADEPASDGP